MEPPKVCALCELTVLSVAESEYVKVYGKHICLECVAALRTDDHLVVYPDPGPGEPFALRRPLLCSTEHSGAREGTRYCSTCDAVVCEECRDAHTEHSWKRTEEAVQELEDMYMHVNYLAQWSEASMPEKSRQLQSLRHDLHLSFQRASEHPELHILQSLGALHHLYADLVDLNTALWGLSARTNYALVRKLTDTGPRQEHLVHWAEWSGCSIHTWDLQSRCMLSQQMPPGFIFPLYCRSLLLDDSTLFLCGGRRKLESHGLKKSWYINFSDWKVSPGPKSILGHANHSIHLFEGQIYVLGGCNETNQFTRQCELLDLSLSRWSPLPDMLQVRDSLASVVNARQRRIYALGGRFRANGCHDSIECFHIAQQRWAQLNIVLISPVYMHGAVLLPYDGRILVFGGLNADDSKTGRAMLINLTSQSVEEIPKMVSVGCVTDEVRVVGNYVIAPIFYGYASRQINKLNLKSLAWELT